MLLRRRRTTDAADDPDVIVEHGPSLAKGPALIAGSLLVAFGLAGLLKNSDFPPVSSSFPDGTVQGTNFLGFEVNGWTDFFAITAGALLLFGAAQHHLAKFMSLLVGLALAACAVIAVIDGQDVLGLAAANFWTKVGFAVAGGAMLVNALMPRTTRRRHVGPAATTTAAADGRAVDPDRDGAYDEGAPTTVHRRGRFGRPGRNRGADPVVDEDPNRTTVAQPPPQQRR
ncbi:MAG TPA: DUF4383 domain-containing protein [Baekduia sp.]|uniref:DUF4383 domain-containing protein n=1 Tax=Baekduia sp. TaxID=2600305 RepID=UPI002CFC67A8|nr:DUF4383 domain-containing protein [Baekduia sp.]HMJ36782.1 DUF4383 domain-containing protein [Baekduia sp.]